MYSSRCVTARVRIFSWVARLAVMLAGRTAERERLGTVSSGADDDIRQATALARSMVARWGMSKAIGPVDLRDSESAWAPLVELGWRHAFSDSARLYADIAGVYKNGGSISGHIYNATLGFEFFPFRHVGFGVEYGAQRIRIDADKRDFDGKLNINLSGPSVFLKARY